MYAVLRSLNFATLLNYLFISGQKIYVSLVRAPCTFLRRELNGL